MCTCGDSDMVTVRLSGRSRAGAEEEGAKMEARTRFMRATDDNREWLGQSSLRLVGDEIGVKVCTNLLDLQVSI